MNAGVAGESLVERLPDPVRRFFEAAARSDAAAMAACFARDADVYELEYRIPGREAIRRWAAAEVVGGAYRLLDVTPGRAGVSVLLTFAHGGPEERVRYDFRVAEGLVQVMRLSYA